MAKKYKIQKINGVKVTVRLKKEHDRPKMPPPTITHKNESDFSRKEVKRQTRKMIHDYQES
ncbi:MAG: hypothetical protein IJ899_16185 [Blautia sp.]|nr:hypothetical protein [Blautia sp.]